MFNPIRIEYITDKIKQHFKINADNLNYLKGLNILDIGCGGGLISEPMARLGGRVTGIDASEKNIKVAKIHAKKNELKINYLNKSPEELENKDKFDIILNLEIVEHVDNVGLYIESCYNLLKKDGLMFTATLNRSFMSYLKAIIGAEYIMRWLPIGTHDWNKFLKPEELEKKLQDKKFSMVEIKGLEFNPLLNKWRKSNNLSVNYIIASSKS
jgi:2-polyprenyl-6-hydroxyphenyl methylase/3-demethylubiquinone-9 3-methyltransferase